MEFLVSEIKSYAGDEGATLILTAPAAPRPQELAKLQELLSLGKPVHAELKQHRQRRSLDANAYFHLLVHKLAAALGLGNEEVKIRMVLEYGAIMTDEAGGKVGLKLPSSVEASAIYPYAKWFDRRVEGGREFNCFIIYKQTHTLDSKEMARLIGGVVEECRVLGLETLTPAELEGLVEKWQA